MPDFPIHEDLDIQDGQTVFKSQKWWKAVVLYEGYRGPKIAVYLWQNRDDGWRRQQKYVIRSLDDREQDKEIIEEFVAEL